MITFIYDGNETTYFRISFIKLVTFVHTCDFSVFIISHKPIYGYQTRLYQWGMVSGLRTLIKKEFLGDWLILRLKLGTMLMLMLILRGFGFIGLNIMHQIATSRLFSVLVCKMDYYKYKHDLILPYYMSLKRKGSSYHFKFNHKGIYFPTF